ncbi:MAG: hypothetical protein KGI08_04775 [Thaumarchaeota archaeon]|nr:hypothetical protein [Nitrososphaerota archaeon]
MPGGVEPAKLNLQLIRGAMIPYQLRSFVGGQSDYEDKGVVGSFKSGQNLDIRKQQDSLSGGQALTDDLAGGTFDAPCYAAVPASDGNTYFFLYNGKIYSRHSDGTYHLVYTETNDSGHITGASEWYDNAGYTYIVYTTDLRVNIKRILGPAYTPAEPWTDVNTASTGTWPKTNLSKAASGITWHRPVMSNGVLLIGNMNTLAQVGYDLSYTSNALQLIPGNIAKTIVERDIYAITGCVRSDNKDESALFSWDEVSLDWNSKEILKYGGLNAMIDTEIAIAQIGTAGQLYLSDLNSPMPIRQIRGGGQCDPDGMTSYHGMALMGIFGNTSGNNGVYSYGRINKNAGIVLNLEYALTCDEIYSVKTVGTDILIVYKSGTAYGVKKVDFTTKADFIYQSLDLIAPLGTRRYPIPLGRLLNWQRIDLQCDPLPTGCKIEVWYRYDKQITQRTLANGTQTDTNGWIQANMDKGFTGGGLQAQDAGQQNFIFYLGQKARVMEIMIKGFSHLNTTPSINEANAYFTVG